MLNRDDVASWIEGLANGGKLYATVGTDLPDGAAGRVERAVDEGLIPRSPAARVGLPRTVAKPVREKETETWTADEVDRFFEVTANYRGAVAFRVSVLYGLRRSEMLALKSKNLEVGSGTLKIDESIVATRRGVTRRTNGHAARSRSTKRRCVRSPVFEPSRRQSVWSLARSGRTTTSSLRLVWGGRCCPVRTTERSNASSKAQSCLGSRRMVCATQRRLRDSPRTSSQPSGEHAIPAC